MVDSVIADADDADPPELVDRALEQLSLTHVTDVTRESLIEFVERNDEMADNNGGQTPHERAAQRHQDRCRNPRVPEGLKHDLD